MRYPRTRGVHDEEARGPQVEDDEVRPTPASTAVASENIRPIPAVVLNEAMSRENIAFEKRTYARVTYNSEYATAVKSVIVFVCLHRGRNTRENHAGNDPRFTAWRIWLCVYGRKGIGPAATTAPPFAFAAASDAPVRGCEMARVRTRIERRERSRAAAGGGGVLKRDDEKRSTRRDATHMETRAPARRRRRR